MSRKCQDLLRFSFSALTLHFQTQQNVVVATGLPCSSSASSPLETWKKVSRHPRSRSAAASHWTLPGQMRVSHWFSGRAKVVSHWTLQMIVSLWSPRAGLQLPLIGHYQVRCLSLIGSQEERKALSLETLMLVCHWSPGPPASAASHWKLPG
jgi:hypothetical protein